MTRKFFKNDTITSEEPVSSARRALLLGAGAAGVAGTVGSVLAPQAAQALSSENVTNAPESEKLHESQAFYGKHQPGIVTPRPAAGLVHTDGETHATGATLTIRVLPRSLRLLVPAHARLIATNDRAAPRDIELQLP